jgi:hypothetical protein
MKIAPGKAVLCAVGTKSGWGIVVEPSPYTDDGWVVNFPEADYPLTMVMPTGLYLVLESSVLQVADTMPATDLAPTAGPCTGQSNRLDAL